MKNSVHSMASESLDFDMGKTTHLDDSLCVRMCVVVEVDRKRRTRVKRSEGKPGKEE